MRTSIVLASVCVLALSAVACDRNATEALSVPVPYEIDESNVRMPKSRVSTTEVTSASVPTTTESLTPVIVLEPAPITGN